MEQEMAVKPLRVAICDDNAEERAFFYNLCKSIKEEIDILIKGKEYEHGEALLFDMEDSKIMNSIDIVLLDIHMPGRSGIDIARRLREYGYQGSIIFITRSAEHWRSAFDVKAFNYITKDDDVKERFVTVFLEAAQAAQERRGKMLVFSSIDETRQIEVSSISHFEVKNHLVTVYYNKNDIFEFVSSLAKIETLVVSDHFIRVHRSFLVSLSHIVTGRLKENSIVMTNGMVIPVSRKYSPKLRSELNKKI